MKLKHVLFSSLFLSAALVACTNDEFAEVNTPSVNTEDAISLGENVTISGVKGSWGADTKAAFDKIDGKLKPYWEEDDVVGAAWYNKVTKLNENGTVAVDGVSNVNESDGTSISVYSNHPFAWLEQVGNKYGAKFQANTNVLAGAYILYFPYDETQTLATEYVPVNLKFPYTVNCAEGHEFDAINENMFSYDEIALVPGGTQTKEFELHQVPVLYQVQFGFQDLDFVKLLPTMTIEKIIMEAYDSNKNSILSTMGKIEPNQDELTADDYNAYLEDWRKNPLPAAAYKTVEEGKVDHYTMDVINADQAAYQLSKLSVGSDGLTEPFYFSALPFIAEKEAATVTFKIVATDGEDEYVFARTYGAASAQVNAINEANKLYETEKPASVALGVLLDTQDTQDIIYTADQFKKAWNEIKEAGSYTLEIGDPLDLSDFDLTNSSNAVIKIQRRDEATYKPTLDSDYLITLKSINLPKANVTFGEGINVKVDGNVSTTGDASLYIPGTLSAKEISLGGAADLTLEEMTKLYVATSGKVVATLPTKAEKSGAIEVNSQGSDMGELTLKGGIITKMTNNGKVTLTGEVSNVGDYWGHIETTTDGKFINEAGATATFTNIVNGMQDVNLDNNGATPDKAAGVININANANWDGKSSNGNAAVTRFGIKGTNKGIINVNQGVLSEGDLKQEGADARIFVNATTDAAGNLEKYGWVHLNNKTADFAGWIVKNNEKVTVTATGANIAYSVKSKDDWNKIADANVANAFIDAAIELPEKSSVDGWTAAALYLNADVTLKGDFYTNKGLVVTGEKVNIINGTKDKATKVNLAVTGDAVIDVTGKLTLDENVTLKGKFQGNSLVNINIDAEGAAIVQSKN